ncbi:MAG TPA: molecular chaperone Tir [Syntrophobacteraceae bacterium]|nr:molecular chaperone Tir [Syntrophobacteraceae bacterium]HBD08459.1 molecular chaperone Tir [Syntrophobacteraceae bacterium]HBZ56457.1 molecular chaperone Tir [Syntrophobacteraceae bacterium]
MQGHFDEVKGFLLDMGIEILSEDRGQELVVASKPDAGIHNLVVDCEEPILVMEQPIMPVPKDKQTCFAELLKMNRYLVHGAFALDPGSNMILWRDTLQLATLDRDELEGSVKALVLALAEYGTDLLRLSKL